MIVKAEAPVQLDLDAIRADFPILKQRVNGEPLIYLDNAATTHKPQGVIDSLVRYYSEQNANVHRGVHTLSQQATDAFEAVREQVAGFIHAPTSRSVIFTRGTTEAVNLVAYAWGEAEIQAGDVIVSSVMEHHSNLVPWQRLAQKQGAELRLIPLSEDGQLDLEAAARLIDSRTKLVAITQMSNVLGTLNDIPALAKMAHAVGAKLFVDGAQSVPHLPVDVQALDCDFLAFSAHKMAGPTGIGVLWGREEILAAMPPFHGGGAMIKEVFETYSTFGDLPYRFEAGTPHIEGVLGLGAALDYLQNLGMDKLHRYETELTAYALEQLQKIEGLQIYGPLKAEQRGGILAFNLAGIHPTDLGALLDQQGIAIRTGHHCCQPLMRRFGVTGMARASLYLYNTRSEVDALISGIQRAQRIFARASKK
ncbi:MAG: cysteine desulfurase [Candidatus Sericytochromatia bacterium]